MTKTYLVTGATGTVGQALVQRLQADGAHAIAGSTSGRSVAGAPGRVVNFEQPDTLDAAFAGVDGLFLLFPLQPNKVQLATHAIEAARRAGVGHVVRSSGAGADVNSPYAIGRLQGGIDALVAGSGLPYTVLRPNSFMQNWVNYYGGMVRGGSVYLANAEGRSAWIDVRDIADAAAAVLQQPAAHAGQTYDLSGPEALSAAEVLDVIRAEAAVSATYVPVSAAQAEEQMRGMGMSPWSIEVMASLANMIVDGTTAETSPHVTQLTGQPGRTLAAFARDHAAQWR